MERALFVEQFDSPETRELLREAGELAAGVDAELIVLHVMEEEEYEEIAESRREVAELTGDVTQLGGYPLTQAEGDAEHEAEQLGWGELYDLDLEWLALGTVGKEGESILDVADNFEVDHLFIVGSSRSPSGKAIFGDLAQQLMIEFDGPVTTLIPEV